MLEFIYLASQSPRRMQLLEQLGVRYELLLADESEDAEALEETGDRELPATYVKRVTQLKLDAAVARLHRRGLPSAPVLCADTTVACGKTIFGKPTSKKDAKRMLRQLSDTTHRVLTAVAVHSFGSTRSQKELRAQDLSISRVTFEYLSDAQIQTYVTSGEPMGKAGAYAIQGKVAQHITHISGSYSGIMGLPLRETAWLLRGAGLNL